MCLGFTNTISLTLAGVCDSQETVPYDSSEAFWSDAWFAFLALKIPHKEREICHISGGKKNSVGVHGYPVILGS